MKKILFTILLLWGVSVQATTITLTPAVTVAGAGDAVTLDLVATGLMPPGGFPIGGYDLDIFWDPAALMFTGYTFGGALGDHGAGEALDFSVLLAPGWFALGELSLLLDPMDLGVLQPEGVVLASLMFDVLSLPDGTSTFVDMSPVSVVDAFALPVSVGPSSAEITASSVPAPATMALFGLGLLVLGFARRQGVVK